jgi:UDP-N-acetylmuramoyl-tripeptide--D-alanyl-D-alanine ligase
MQILYENSFNDNNSILSVLLKKGRGLRVFARDVSMATLFSLKELIETAPPVVALGVCVDSRLLEPGQLFFALPGMHVDGHRYLAEAASKGAVAAVVNREYAGEDFGLPLLRVENGLLALQGLAKKVLGQRSSQVVAVTGSYGKTTTKDFVSTILMDRFKIASSPGNSNSQIGLPLAILNHTSGDEELLILEMGMTHPGQLSALVDIAPPVIALITAIGLVHACNFDSLVQIAQAKAEIFSHPKTQLGIFHHEILSSGEVRQIGSCRKLTFSETSKEADYVLERRKDRLHVHEKGTETAYLPLLSIPGEHYHHNFLAAIAVARALNMSWEEIADRQPFLQLPERRLQFVEKKGVLFIDDSYNASEMTVKAALRSMPQPKSGRRKVAVIGEMLELGKFSKRCHLEVGEFAMKHVDWMLCLGTECAPIYTCWTQAGRPVVWENERSALVSTLRSHLRPGDVVLLKGSRLKQLWKILEEF